MDKPDKRLHRYLLSTTSRLIGEYDSPDWSIAHAFSGSRDIQFGLQEGPHSRNFFVLTVSIDEPEQRSIVPPNYGPVGDRLASLLSILYGKRFDHHGKILSGGIFNMPDLSAPRPTAHPFAGPNNHKPRPDVDIPLNLKEFARLAPILHDDSNAHFLHILFAAARFYNRALRMFDVDPEFAYLDLVTCGEILANFYEYKAEELFDDETRKSFDRIASEMRGGDKIVRQFRGEMRRIKRAYTMTITRLVNDYFFGRTEAREAVAGLKKDDFVDRIKAAYDVRSQYVHTGIDFGRWTPPHTYYMNEIQIGRPVIENNDRFQEAITKAPTFYGLERVMRFCLLRFIHTNGVPIDPALDGPGICGTPVGPKPASVPAEDSPKDQKPDQNAEPAAPVTPKEQERADEQPGPEQKPQDEANPIVAVQAVEKPVQEQVAEKPPEERKAE